MELHGDKIKAKINKTAEKQLIKNEEFERNLSAQIDSYNEKAATPIMPESSKFEESKDVDSDSNKSNKDVALNNRLILVENKQSIE